MLSGFEIWNAFSLLGSNKQGDQPMPLRLQVRPYSMIPASLLYARIAVF